MGGRWEEWKFGGDFIVKEHLFFEKVSQSILPIFPPSTQI
jgi:hypothetical protein